ncbi:hypothetical protein B7494_g4986 [Chlorociboria aeruginascens]|nr:hypothetical protein B7494_g4986 [Chlorociboria aeruginascens]
MASEQRPPFPIYLLPTFFPFRRRQSSTTSISSIPALSYSPNSTPSSSPPSWNYFSSLISPHQKIIEPSSRLSITQPNVLKCTTCSTDIAYSSQIVSKGFTGRHGRAYLVSGPPLSSRSSTKSKDLINTKTGRSRYKIGKYILETKRVVVSVSWEDGADIREVEEEEEEDGVVVFDEDDEDECEDLFSGVWDPAAVAKRRGRKVGVRRKDGES